MTIRPGSRVPLSKLNPCAAAMGEGGKMIVGGRTQPIDRVDVERGGPRLRAERQHQARAESPQSNPARYRKGVEWDFAKHNWFKGSSGLGARSAVAFATQN